jgi:cytochrome c oxidase cbb3-type subunit 1
MAGFVTSLLILILAVLLDEDGDVFNGCSPFIAWHGASLLYVVVFVYAGWIEGGDPGFTIIPSMTRNWIYVLRLILGLAMTGASAHWLMCLTQRMRRKTQSPFSMETDRL